MTEPSARTDVARFAWKAALLSAPLVFAAGTYLVTDPFRVLRDHTFGDYYDEAAPVELNRDYVSLQLYLRQDPEIHYNAFMFGSSRSAPFHARSWAGHLNSARPFHYPAASENILGISKKLLYLNAHGAHVEYALLEMGTALSGVEPRHDPTHRLPFQLTGQSWFAFQTDFFKDYFADFFFLKHAAYVVTGRVPNWSRSALGIVRGDVRIDPVTNDYYFLSNERELAADPEGYYAHRAADLPPEPPTPTMAEPVIAPRQRKVLEEIASVLAAQKTDYRIVMTPDYKQVAIAAADLEALRAIFGRERVFDFTGANALSADRTHFYDSGHVRPEIADEILDRIYGAPAAPSP